MHVLFAMIYLKFNWFLNRRNKITKTDKKTKANVESVPKPNVDSEVDYVQNNSYFVLEQCPQYISKRSRSSNESPYSNSKEGVYDHLRDNKSRKPEVEDTYQHASAGVSRDMSEYDTMANTVNQNQEEGVSYDYTHQDTNKRNGSDSRANNLIIGNPYDIAVWKYWLSTNLIHVNDWAILSAYFCLLI